MSEIGELTAIEAAERLAALSCRTKDRFASWQAERWSGNEAPYEAFRAIGAAIASKRNPIPEAELKALFAFAERLLRQGSGEVRNLVATCMLETIRTAARESGFDFAVLDPCLGAEARRYLIARDRFDQTRTPGLSGR